MESQNDVFRLPPYLLKTPYGESLKKQLVQPVGLTKSFSQASRLSTYGVMGSMPARFSDSDYDQSLVSMLTPHPSRAGEERQGGADTLSAMDEHMEEDHDPLESIYYNEPMDVDVEDEDDEDHDVALDVDDDEEDSSYPLYPDEHQSGVRRLSTSRRRRSSARSGRTIRRGGSVSGTPSVFKYPLPLKWIVNPNTQMTVTDGGLSLKVDQVRTAVSSSSISKNYDFHNAKANATVPVQAGVFYYEVKITNATNNSNKSCCDVSIGFMLASVGTVTKMAGLEIGTYGFNGHEGTTTSNQTVMRRYNREFGQGDTIGCGVNFATKKVFYTKNGIYLGTAFKDINKPIIPIISLKSGNAISTNFGMQEFLFDIEGYIDQEKRKVTQKVMDHTSTGHGTGPDISPADMDLRVNTNTDKELPSLMQKLVSSYFDHLGYVDISKTFSAEVKREQLEGSTKMGSNIVLSDEEMIDDKESTVEEKNLKVRQQIRKNLLEGDIDGAIKLTNAHFPKVFAEHEEILFKLSCNKFIELIKRSDIDDAIQYGQSLREKYNENTRYQEFLNDIFSLLAYENPQESEFGYLLKEGEILKISDELNSEILKSLGKSSVSELESLIKHTKVMLNVLSLDTAQPDTLLLTNEEFGL